MREKMTLSAIKDLLAKTPLPNLAREADTLCMTGDMWMKIKEALAPTLVAKTISPANRYMGMDIISYPAGTIVYDTKTGQQSVIDENSVLCVTRSDVVLTEPAGRVALQKDTTHG